MDYELTQGVFPSLSISLNEQEKVYAQVGAMSWMDKGIVMQTNMKGGLFRAIGRKLTGNSMFLVTFTAKRAGLCLGFASNFIGTILPVQLHGNSVIVQKNGFLCAQSSIDIKTAFVKKLSAALWGGEGFMLQKISGKGLCFLEGSGQIFMKDLGANETIYVNTGNLLAFQDTVDYSIEIVKGVRNVLFGGEGLFLTRLTGPGKVMLQTLTAQDIAGRLMPHFVNRNRRS